MTVDLLRRGYTTKVKFFRDSDELTEVVWFPSVSGAPILPYATLFHSYEWEAEMPFGLRTPGTTGVGEQIGEQRNYGNNRAPAFHPWRGSFCGTQDQWENGTALPPEPPVPVWADGFPHCCGLPMTLFPNIYNCHDQLRLIDAISAMYVSEAAIRAYFAATWPDCMPLEVVPDGAGPTPGYCIGCSLDNTIVIVSGTSNAVQWAVQIIPAQNGPVQQGPYSTHAIHEFAADRLYRRIVAVEPNHDVPIVLAGHSFGGSVCLLTAVKILAQSRGRLVRVLTIGCPKIGDNRLVALMMSVDSRNFVNDLDPVPRLPPGAPGDVVILQALVGNQIALNYASFLPPPYQVGLSVAGVQTASPSLDLGAVGIGLLVQQLLGLAPFGPLFPHNVAAYRARIALTCPEEAPNMIVGEVFDFAGDFVPPGTLELSGQLVSRVTYAALFAVLGTKWGVGDGATTFGLPDARGRGCVGAGVDGDGNVYDVGDYVGENTTLLEYPNLPSYNLDVIDVGHIHGITDPGHIHGITDPGHIHAVTDPTHAHAVTDPGHYHTINFSLAGGATFSGTKVNANTNRPGLDQTQAAVTGVTVDAAATGLTVDSHVTGTTADSAFTAVSINVESTGVIVFSKGMDVPFSRRPPQLVVRKLIWSGV